MLSSIVIGCFRITQAGRHGWYDFLEEVYGGQGMYSHDPFNKYKTYPANMEEVYLNTAHRPEDLIVRYVP